MSKNILFLNPVPLIYRGIMPGFKQNGWNTFLCMGDEFFLNESAENQYIKLNQCIKKYKINVVFLEFRVGADFPVIHQCCKDNDVKFIIYGVEDVAMPDFIEGYNDWINHTVNHCDLYLTTTEELILYVKQKYNKDIYLFTFGLNKEFHKQGIYKKEYSYDMVFCGNNYLSRYDDFESFIMPLIRQNKNIMVWGNQWWLDKDYPVNLCEYPDFYKGYLPYDELNNLYSSCKIAFGMNCSRVSKSQCSMRPTEVMGVGGGSIYISPYSPAQENLFGKSGEFAFFPKTPSEMFENINYVLNMSNIERLEMSRKAQKMVYEKHNYKDKIEKIIKLI